MSDFYKKRVTQSQYRGSLGRVNAETDVFADLELKPLGLSSDEDKKAMRALIEERTLVILENLLSDEQRAKVQGTPYLETIFEKLEI